MNAMNDDTFKIDNKLLRSLNNQRKTGQFCDVNIKLHNDFAIRAHFCVVAPQSSFIGGDHFLQESCNFSIHNPLTIEILNFDCNECLEVMFDFFYSKDISISKEHQTHMKTLANMLGATDIIQIFKDMNMNDDLDIHGELSDNIEETISHILNPPHKNIKLSCITNNKTTQKKMHQCPGCNFRCYKPSAMIVHHSEVCSSNKAICSLCDASFRLKSDFHEHLHRHIDPKPFFCPDCDLRFLSRAALNFHTPKHSSETPYMCSYCGKGFKWKHGLSSHLIVHSNEKKFLCDECGYSTAHLQTLRTHKLSHTGASWKCSVNGCNHTTRRKESLKHHIATHRKETPFVCEICGHRFSQSKNLKRHAQLHISRNLYKCTYCSFGSYRSDKLKEHQIRQHMGKSVEDTKIISSTYEDPYKN